MADQLLAAAVEIDITPPVGTSMAGYGARTDSSIGVHDPLLGQLLLLQLGSQRIALITLDLIGVGLELTRQIRAGIADLLRATCYTDIIESLIEHLQENELCGRLLAGNK